MCRRELPATVDVFGRNKRMGDGLHWYCRECRSSHRRKNLERFLASERAAHARNRAQRNAYTRSRWVDPEFRAKQLEANKAWHRKNADAKRAKNQRWRAENPEKVRKHLRDAYLRNQIRHNVSGHIAFCLKRVGSSKARRRFESLLGYGVDDLRRHIERQFRDGMTWDNHGSLWELDHIVPLASFTFASADDAEFRAAWALSNLQPLFKKHNRSKGGRRITLL